MTHEEWLNSDFRTLASRWLFAQGTSTVLLVAILAWLAYAFHFEVPAHIDQLTAAHQRAENKNRDTYERDQQRDEERYNGLFRIHFEGGLRQ